MRTIHFVLIQLCLFQVIDGSSSFEEILRKSKMANSYLSPVILSPGLGGNKLEAKLNKMTTSHWWCDRTTEDYFDVWLGFRHLLPGIIDCWVDTIKLRYNNISRRTMNAKGVKIKIPPFGDTESLEWLTEGVPSLAYFYDITQALVDNGYTRKQSIFGAPYDFRKGPNENKYWFKKMKNLTEHAYKMNKNVGVTYIAHSMGGNMLLNFLQQMTQEWKNKYVKRAITIAVPWGGTVLAVQAASIGYDLGFSALPNDKMNQIQSTFPSIAWLMPSKYFWKPHEVLTTIGEKNYTTDNLNQYFYDIGSPNMADMREDLADYNSFNAPGVEVHCLYGTKTDTVERLDFGMEFNSNPSTVEGDGDGLVNTRSLIGCKHWKNATNREIYVREFPDKDHMEILGHSEIIDYILKAVATH